MKPLQKFLAVLILGILFLSTSCKKEIAQFPQGGIIDQAPTVVLKEWSMEKALKNGISLMSVPENPQINEVTEDMTFRNDGTFSRSNRTIMLSGTWALINSNAQLECTITNPSANASKIIYNIVKLTSGTDGQFIWEHDYNGAKYRYESRSSL